MVDARILVRMWLLAQSSITSALGLPNANPGSSIYAAPDLPKLFLPSVGPCVQIHSVGGPPPHPEILTVVDEKLQVRVWANKEQYTLARQVYAAVRDVMHGACSVDVNPHGFVIRCLEVMPGQDLSDPDDGYASVVGTYQLMARAS